MGMFVDGTAASTSWLIIWARYRRREDCMGNSSVLEAGLLEVSLKRRIAASPEVVFRAWIDAKHLAGGGGPEGVTKPVWEAGPRGGGGSLVYMGWARGTGGALARGCGGVV